MPHIIEVYQNLKNYFEAREELKQPFYININHEQKIKKPYLKGEDMARLKNITKRQDGRWLYSKTINGIRTYTYAKTQKELLKKIKAEVNEPTEKIKQKYTCIDLINDWYNTYKKNIVSTAQYKRAIEKYFNKPMFKKDIRKITFEELENFLLNIEFSRTKAYCYYIIKGVYNICLKKRIVREDLSQLLTKPKNESKKGEHFNLKEQKLIIDNLDTTPIKNEILFYVLTGCRRTEAVNVKVNDIDFENLSIHVKGTKTTSADRYVPISKSFAEILKANFSKMFDHEQNWYSRQFQNYLKKLNIPGHKLHDLRHTFSTNLHYLKVPDKERQYYLGHTSIAITNDIYTHLDPNITKEQILNLYKDLYPEF